MNDSTLVIFSAMLAVAAVIAIGIWARRKKWLTQAADASLLRLIVNVLLPCLIFDVIVGNPKLGMSANIAQAPATGFALASLGMLLAWGAAKLVGPYVGLTSPAAQRTFGFSAGLFNYGYIPIPLTDVLWRNQPEIHDPTMGTLLIHNIGVELALWTVGILILTGTMGQGWLKRVFNPVSLTVIASLIINTFVTDALVPEALQSGLRKAVHMLGASSVPLSLVLVGATIVDNLPSFKPRLAMGTIGLGVVVRLGILPVIALLLAYYIPSSDELKRVMIIQASMPSAMIPIILARHYEGDPATALRVALGTTIVAIITMPLWLQFGFSWLNLSL